MKYDPFYDPVLLGMVTPGNPHFDPPNFPMFTSPPSVPALESLPAGYPLRAGMGVATILPDMDFECYSEAGFVWDEALGKWGALPGAPSNKKGLFVVGAAVYAQDPSAEVISFYYDLKAGAGRRFWCPGMPLPFDLFDHIARGGLVEAWNVAFERWIWNHVCVPKYGWPALPLEQTRCAMGKSRASAFPGALGKAAEVMQLVNQKNPDGDRLIKKFSIPRNPSAKDKRKRLLVGEDPVDGPRMFVYNEQDIIAEAEASSKCPDLEGEELAFWLADQTINTRGVQIDVAALHDCIAIVDQAHGKYNAELYALTGGEVARASELAKLQQWLHARGVHLDSLDEEHLEEALAQDDLNRDGQPHRAPMRDDCRRALEIRAAIGSAAVKKVFAMRNQVTRAGRLHDLFSYHAAHTGRATGNGPQPTNLPNSGPAVFCCGACTRHFGPHLTACPWCGMPQPPGKKSMEWHAGAVVDALHVIAGRSLELVEQVFGDAMATVSGCLRGLFIAAEGKRLMCSDYSSIEAVGAAMMSGEQWRIDVFRTHGKIYEASASMITGVPFDEMMEYRKRTGTHHPLRKSIGKYAELACFSPGTQVLTDRGYVDIVDVVLTDKLWDGIEWVSHAGVIPKGEREVMRLDGVEMTPTHPISLGRSWQEARKVAFNVSMLSQALAIGSASLPSFALRSAEGAACENFGSNAVAGRPSIKSILGICIKALRRAATCAQNWHPQKGLKSFGLTRKSCQTSAIGAGSLTGSLPPSGVVMTPTIGGLGITAPEGFLSTMLGASIAGNFYATPSRLRGGITRIWKWIGETWTGDTSPAISDLSRNNKTFSTDVASPSCSKESPNLRPVYDIVNAGPRHRFTIKTNSGHLIVHNSGYQGWIGAWKAFGADEHLTDEEIKQAILKWRAKSPNIVEMWGGQYRGRPWSSDYKRELFGIEGMFVAAVMNPGQAYEFRGLTFQMRGDALYLRLLSGRYLTYHRPRLSPSVRDPDGLSISYEGWNTNPKNGPVGWIRKETWGGRLFENIDQAVCRDILRFAIVNLEAAGYAVVLHVYDEIVAEVPEGWGSLEEFERIMATMPAWASDWPIKATGGWVDKRYHK